MIKERIKQLQDLMKQHDIDLYIIPTSDDHQSEYVGEYFKCRQFMSGFTGSAGTMVVTHDEAYLWVDGRYFIQAENEIKDTGIHLMKMRLPHVLTLHEFLKQHPDDTIGFDGKVMAYGQVEGLPNNIIGDYDLVGEIWQDRPALSCQKAYLYDLQYCGQSRKEKLEAIRKEMKDYSYHLITSLDDIMWIFNIRGQDVHCNPVVNSYALIEKDKATLYVQKNVFDQKAIEELKQDDINIKDYYDIYQDVEYLTGHIMLNKNTVNYSLVSKIIHGEIVNQDNPSQLMKAIKNDVEIKATKNAHLKDGIAVTKFMYWLKHCSKDQINEVDISNKLETFRSQQENFLDISFDTICAYQANGALMHYHASEKQCSSVHDSGLLLIDSGGQYLDGTTDITRTFVLGDITQEQKHAFTVALKAMLRLQNAHFIQGTTGANLDILARGIVYEHNLDYRCGTGHGVGHLLSVHEGPNSIRPRDTVAGHKTNSAILPGMITTDEPGIYKEGQYGIRHENELLCVKEAENEYGTFLKFEPITYVPFDIDGIDASLLNNEEIKQFNEYQKMVYHKLESFMTDQEKQWLQDHLYIAG